MAAFEGALFVPLAVKGVKVCKSEIPGTSRPPTLIYIYNIFLSYP